MRHLVHTPAVAEERRCTIKIFNKAIAVIASAVRRVRMLPSSYAPLCKTSLGSYIYTLLAVAVWTALIHLTSSVLPVSNFNIPDVGKRVVDEIFIATCAIYTLFIFDKPYVSTIVTYCDVHKLCKSIARLLKSFVVFLVIFVPSYAILFPDIAARFSSPMSVTPYFGARVSGMVLLNLAVAVVEEAFWKGFVFRRIDSLCTSRQAVLFTSASFGIWHLTSAATRQDFVGVTMLVIGIGIPSACAYKISNKLSSAIGYHWAYNVCNSLISGNDLFHIKGVAALYFTHGLETSVPTLRWLGYLLYYVVLAYVMYRMAKKKGHWKITTPRYVRPVG